MNYGPFVKPARRKEVWVVCVDCKRRKSLPRSSPFVRSGREYRCKRCTSLKREADKRKEDPRRSGGESGG